jgi:hypothetical protein
MSRRALAILSASALLQIAVATLPDTMGDLLSYRTWTRTLAAEGLAAAYWPPPAPADSARFSPPVDYPPLFPYTLWAVGKGLRAVSAEALRDDRLLDFLIRLPLVVAMLLLACVVYWEARRVAPGVADLALALVALNPGLLFDTAYWSQADAPWALLVAVALVALVRGRPEWSWAAMTAAMLVKPLACPFAPLVALETLRRFGPARTLRGAAAGAGVVALAMAPFAAIGRLPEGVEVLFFQIEAMPFASVNAHNLWWLLSGGVPWADAATRLFGIVSFKAAGLALFGSFFLVTLVRLGRSREPRALYIAAASTAIGFFVLSTHMHENHLFGALPLLALAGLEARPARIVCVALSVTFLANLLLHDPFLTHLVRPYVPGPQLLLPQQLDVPKHLEEYLTAQGYPGVAEEIRGETSLLGLLATLVNAQATVLLFAGWLAFACAGRGFDAVASAGRGRPSGRAWAVAAALFVVATGAPFARHVLRYADEHVFLLRFLDAEVRTEVPDRVRISSFEIGGERRKVLYVHPASEVRYTLTPPREASLRFGIALSPEVWSPEKGDGVLFEIRAEQDGAERTLFSRYIDPKQRPEDRGWQDVSVDLASCGGRAVTLIFATGGGPAGDIRFDWAGFSDPTLVGR